MENLTFNSDKKLESTNFFRVGDLSYFEGPLLSLFEEFNSGHFYVFDWVDRNHKLNRWIIYRVSPEHLLQFLSGKLSHLELFENRPNKTIYFTDIASHNKSFFHYEAFQLENLPNSYIPNNDNFFEPLDCNAFEKIKSVVINALSRQKSENEYSESYSMGISKHKEIKSVYYNTIHDDFKTITNRLLRSKSFNFDIMSDLTSNKLEYSKFESYHSFKKPEPTKRKEYANQYS